MSSENGSPPPPPLDIVPDEDEASHDKYPYDLGAFGKRVTTASACAQAWFDRGLTWTYAYNHAEAIECFERAIAADPRCAMAHWGVAYAAGPNYNYTWDVMDPASRAQILETARDATERAQALVSSSVAEYIDKNDEYFYEYSPVERALIAALGARYPEREPPAEITTMAEWNQSFTSKMREAREAYPEDVDVATVFVEAILLETPWKMWDLTNPGQPGQGAKTFEAQATLETLFFVAETSGSSSASQSTSQAWTHPGALHLYVHLMEMSPTPEKALRAADALRELVPDAGHLVHMPTHIDIQCGQYKDAVVYNQKAVRADNKVLGILDNSFCAGIAKFYNLYRVHNLHFVVYGAMFLGQFEPAMAAADELLETTPDGLVRTQTPPMADFVEGYLPLKQHVLIRFGKWDEILAQSQPDDTSLYCSVNAFMWYSKSVANSALGNIKDAEHTRAKFIEAKAKVPATRVVHNVTVRDQLEIAQSMLDGELEYRRENYDEAFAHLREAVRLDDALPYDEPWGWMQPARHALGALLMEQKHFDEAAAVYRADLGLDATLGRARQHPNNLWSLHGLYECLKHLGSSSGTKSTNGHCCDSSSSSQSLNTPEAVLVKQQLDIALARAQVPVHASCYCRRS